MLVNLKLSKDLTLYKHIFLQVDARRSFVQSKPPNGNSTFKLSLSRCSKNISAASIPDFSSFPRDMQDFLYYRHCRHFPMILDVPDKCGGAERSGDIFLLLVIKSPPVNYDRREVLRRTWAKERLQNGVWIRRVFLSGTKGDGVEKKRLNKLVQLEQQQHNDILQWDFVDSFFNLTLKQVLFLQWMDRNCPNVRFLMNGDDDVLAHTDNMVEYLKSLKDSDGSKHLFIGNLMEYSPAIRESGSKYFVPADIYPSEYFPPYCSGGGYMLSGYTAHVIYNMSHSTDIITIDDAYMGMCMEKAGLGPASHGGIKVYGHRSPDNTDPLDPCYFRDILIVHRFLPLDLFLMWNSLHDPSLKCNV